jgi:hypothetical protein
MIMVMISHPHTVPFKRSSFYLTFIFLFNLKTTINHSYLIDNNYHLQSVVKEYIMERDTLINKLKI